MELPDVLQPFEILRRIRVFWRDILSDFELRHPEVRKRIAFELNRGLSQADVPRFKNLMKRFLAARRIISFFDWPLLLEWNERKLQAETLIHICAALDRELQNRDSQQETIQKLQERLQEICELVRQQSLGEAPSLLKLLGSRLYYSPLRNESSYLISRLEQLTSESPSFEKVIM